MVCSHGVAPCSSALLCVLLLVLIVTMTTGEINRYEEECQRESGVCIARLDCPSDKVVNKTNLCPKQEDKGVVCCFREEINTHEVECLREGGVCVSRLDCPLEKMMNKTDLCPQQQDKGAVCCHAVPDTDRLCRQNGGECGKAEACANVPSFGQLDCEEGTECCLLIF